MSRKLLSLAVLASAFCLTLGTADAQARHCRSQNRHRCCNQNSNCGFQQTNNCGQQQASYNGCQQTTACGNPQSNCGNAQAAGITTTPVGYTVPQPPMEQEPAPAPGR